MTIYLDIVFLENVFINYTILIATTMLLKQKFKFGKALISRTLGYISSIILFLIKSSLLIEISLKILISVIMILIVYGKKKFLRNILFFYLTSLVFGGVATIIIFSIKPESLNISEKFSNGTILIKNIIKASIISTVVIFIVSKLIKNNELKKRNIYDLEIFYKGKMLKIKAFLDSGNLLKEPITGKSVIIVEKDSLKGIVERDVIDNLKNILSGKWLKDVNAKFSFFIIPFVSLGNDNGILIGFKPEYIKIYAETEILKNDIVIGIYDGKLNNNNLYTSLIGLNVLNEEEYIDEFI